MTGWNLPPGVSGTEDIFGPKRTYYATLQCEYCERTTEDAEVDVFDSADVWQCAHCDEVNEIVA